MNKNDRRVKYACYTTNIAMSVVSNLAPILFITFRDLYGISYTLLGLLVLINFCTQLFVDLFLSFFSHRLNIARTVKLIPLLTLLGLVIFALAPFVFGEAVFVGLVIGTVIYSASGGLAEVLISPVIAALPSDNPERELSKLHSVYAWGVVGVVPVATLSLLAFGNEIWYFLTIGFALIPLLASILFMGARLPNLATPERVTGALKLMKSPALWLCLVAIFLGGATECTMAQWGSGYIEAALGIPKVWGDLLGVAVFYVMLATGRTLFGKYGKRIEGILLVGAIGAFLCYTVAAISPLPILGLVACALTGLCVSMLWPGSLIVGSERVPAGGVFVYAMMAAGGDLGASVGPQLVGALTDRLSANGRVAAFASELGLTAEQLGMRLSMLTGSAFALLATAVYIYILISRKKYSSSMQTEGLTVD